MAGFLKVGSSVELRTMSRRSKMLGLEPGKKYTVERIDGDIVLILVDSQIGFSLGNGKRGAMVNINDVRKV